MTQTSYATQLDEIDQWLLDSFGILPESTPHSTARMVAEALWPKAKEGDPPEYRPPILQRYAEVLQAAQIAVGKKMARGRGKEDVLIRMFVAYRLRCEGYPFEAIGKVLGRNHSTIVHLVGKKMADMLSLPKIYLRELKMYNKMNEILGNI